MSRISWRQRKIVVSCPLTTTTAPNHGLDLASSFFATAVQPVASPTAVTSTQGAAQTLPVVATAGDPLVPRDPAATRLDAPAWVTTDADGTVVLAPGEAHYELDRTVDTVLFTP